MLIVLIVLIILAIIVGVFSWYNDYDITCIVAFAGAVILGISSFVMTIEIVTKYELGYTAKYKVEMYQEENKKIEKEVNVLVEKYINHENNTFKDLKTTSPTTLVSLYPELKSNELVNKQIDIYVSNNSKIKELKEQQIDMKLAKWLLYFGN